MRAERRTRQEALSLLEVVVGIGLGALLLTMLIQLMIPSLRLSARAGVRTEMQETCFMALQDIAETLQKTVPAGLGYVDGVVAVQPIADADDQGRLLFVPELFSYSCSQGVLRRHHWKPLPAAVATLSANVPTRLTATQLDLLPTLTSQAWQERALARGVTRFSLEMPVAPPNLACPLTIRLELQRQEASNAVERFQLERSLTLRTP